MIFAHNPNASKNFVRLIFNILAPGWIGFSSFFLWFAFIFTEKRKILKRKLLYPALFILPLILIYKHWTGFILVDYTKQYFGWIHVWSDSVWAHLFYIYYLSFVGLGLYLIFNFSRKTENLIKKKQAKIIFTSAIISLGLGTFTDVVLPKSNIYVIPNLAHVFVLIWALGLVYGMVKYKLLVITPATAADNIISTMAESLILLNRDKKIAFINKATSNLLGYKIDELKDKMIDIIFSDDFRSAQLSKIIEEKSISNYDFYLKTKSRRNIPVIFSSSTLKGEAGNLMGFVCMARDITERKEAEEALQQSYLRLQKTLDDTVNALATTVETRDPYTAGHQRRVTQLACTIAEEMGFSKEQVKGIKITGLLHDIGKIYVPAEILSKPGRLTEMEFGIMKTHSRVGFEILKTVEFQWPVAQIVLQHHERMNGSGYPQGIRGQAILLEARILSVADVVEAMSSHRPYRPALGIDKALEEILQNKGTLYDSEVVDVCVRLFIGKRFNFDKK